MQSPEILLQDLNTALRELRGAAHVLGDERLDSELLPTMRRLLLAEVLGNTSILAIGGSQGAGKTTLLRSLYGLEGGAAEWLQPNEGRGERLPVLVLEDAAQTHAQGSVRKLREVAGQYRVNEDPVDVSAFQKAVCDPDPEVLLPVLKVPQRYFNRPNQAWLLLPGYEKQDRQNKSWQELMRQALIGAAGCVIVTDETRMANQQQVEIVKDMLSNELRGAQPLIVISKTEAARGKPERLQELRVTAGEAFGLAAEQREHRVVCAGSDDPAYVAEWLPLLHRAINDLAISGCSDRKAQLARLEDVLGRDLTLVLGLVQTRSQLFFQKKEVGEGGQEVLLACLEAFDEARDGLRVEYNKNIGEMLDAQFAPAWKQLQERLINDHEGFFNQAGAFFGKASEVQQRIESDVARSWGCPDVVMTQYSKAIGNITQKKLGAPISPGEREASLLPGSSPLQRLGYVGADQKPICWKRPDKDDERNLRVLLAGRNSPAQVGTAQKPTKDFERSVKLLPALTLEYARLASLMPAVVGVAPDSLMAASASEQHDLMNQAVQQLEKGADLGQTVLRSIATILTVDIAADGEVDVVKAFLNALSPETVATVGEAGVDSAAAAGGAAAIGGVGAAVVGMVAVGYLTYSALRAVRQQDESGRVVAHAMLMNIKEHYQRHFMHHFDQMMDEVRTRLRQALRERYHLDERLMEKDRLAKAIADVRTLQRDLLDELGRSGRTLALFNVESAT